MWYGNVITRSGGRGVSTTSPSTTTTTPSPSTTTTPLTTTTPTPTTEITPSSTTTPKTTTLNYCNDIEYSILNDPSRNSGYETSNESNDFCDFDAKIMIYARFMVVVYSLTHIT